MSFSEMNRRTLAFRGGGLVTASGGSGGGGSSTNNNAGGEASAWPQQPQPRQPQPLAPQQLNGRGADEEVELEGLEPQDLEASAGAAAAAEETKELLLPQDAGGPTSLGGGGAGGPLLAERNRRTLAFRGGGGGGGLGNNGSSRGRPETSAWPLRHFNGRGPAAVDLELDALEGKELMQDGASLSDSTEDEEEGASLGDGSGAEGGSCSSSRRSGGDGGDEVEGSGVGAGEGETVQHFPLARPKSLMQKLQCSFQTSWLKDFPWLRYSKDTGLMSCGWCQKTPEDGGSGDLPQVGHDELSRGTRNYKKTLLLRHHVSTEHKLHEANAQESEIPSEEGYCDFNSRPNENSYCYQLLRQLNEQRKKGILCDVSIVVSGKIFKAHKNILVAGSRFFKTLYCFSNKESPNQNNTTHLDIAAVQGFSVILDFLYSGNLVLTSQNAIEVMTVASYLQMSEVVQTCRNFIKDALNISIKSEAPESVVVDYNNRKPVNRDGLSSSRDQKIASFWATRNLTNLASNVKIENDGCNVDEGQIENYQMNDSSWVQDGSPELAENESQGQTKVFIWNNMGSQGIQETGKTRRKNQTTKRFIYNIPPNETNLEDCSVMQPPVAYPEEDLSFIKEEPDLDGALLSGPDCDRNVNTNLLAEASSNQDGGDAGTSHDFKYGLMPGPSSDFKYGLLPGTSNDFKYGLIPGASNDFKYGLLPESWPKQETWENGESSLIMNKLKCPHCSYVAKYRRTLKRHLLIHTGVRSFSCDICGKLFTRREHVKRHSLVHKKDKKYKCMVCKKIFMLAASVGIRHGSRRYGVCVDCADKSQPGGQEGVDQGQDTDFPRDEEYEENEVGEADEELVDDGEDQNDPSRWDESGDVCMSLDD
ncbi:zinc finger and BTB domain-containing protein 10 isoform X1 [Prionailurus viverrinus]|uniref:Zinc finger and BTB domain-containing protein 10 isoform X1 n=1 Tax=Acinonyx jubatus TaxID=32536 RepID=A0A6J1ZVH8_ACIJB|nr:zinc finger and BTB domain-containing protein 10 isoform X1 [Acinonyx jubatus]XP_043457192.1 zinc finger and BTB domain-containing protein 10 isoform X1 [Prionailurus bengalensis]XP_045310753.1 zinc finger and BTB domain-containing protein 10 isoform X1 [Leopardus geoffroyi]XP_046930024.1 zinc finger and BTB domain-containing protein 10 isoform X1 [Lynx rufus]XP_047698565.1 zinc finger and BTB domain-containing protein 10 isoform X1 [Prionailurus viverrinus]